jgi:hypothetical protein
MSRKAGDSDSCSSCGLWSSVVSRHDIELCEAPPSPTSRPPQIAGPSRKDDDQSDIDRPAFISASRHDACTKL